MAVREDVKRLFNLLPLTHEEELLLLSLVSPNVVLNDRRILCLLASMRAAARHAAKVEYRDKFIKIYKNYGTTSPLFIAVAYTSAYRSREIKVWAEKSYNIDPEHKRFIPINREDSAAALLVTCLMVVEMGYACASAKSLTEMCSVLMPRQRGETWKSTWSISWMRKTIGVLIKHGWVIRIKKADIKPRLAKYPKVPKMHTNEGGLLFYPSKDGLDLYSRINEHVAMTLERIRKW